MCESLYQLLLQYFDSGIGKINRQEIELNACKYAIKFLIPITEQKIISCEVEYQSKYYELYQKLMAFAGRRSLEHFFDYMEMNNTKRVLANRRGILKPFLFYLNKITFSDTLKYIVASYPPSAGKSVTLTFWTAWLYGISRDYSIIRMSYSDDLVAGFSRNVREIITDKRYRDVFPEYRQYGDNPFATKEV